MAIGLKKRKEYPENIDSSVYLGSNGLPNFGVKLAQNGKSCPHFSDAILSKLADPGKDTFTGYNAKGNKFEQSKYE